MAVAVDHFRGVIDREFRPAPEPENVGGCMHDFSLPRATRTLHVTTGGPRDIAATVAVTRMMAETVLAGQTIDESEPLPRVAADEFYDRDKIRHLPAE